jgi:ankyrin repeat protein
MSDAIPLKPRPHLEQYQKLAKELQQACKSDKPGAIRDWAVKWELKIASLMGLELDSNLRRQIDFDGERIERQWHKYQKINEGAARCTLAESRYFIARAHGFASWTRFARHVEALGRKKSIVAKYEAAADAIANGNLAKLKKLLRENPELIDERSTREHRSTLLHYVSANGIEDFRQKTPRNILEITKLLLDAGADVNAESDAYGGRSTTLGLTATSWHPENAGVQLPLMKLLIEHGAIIDGPDGGSAVNGCLHNGRGEAAQFFADHGAQLDLEAASGVGRLDVVKSFFRDDGRLKSGATKKQLADGFAWACEFGWTNVVEFLLQKGFSIDTRLKHNGQIGLHWAALGGHADTVELLLKRGAAVDSRDQTFKGTPLEWALYGWGNPSESKRAMTGYYKVIALLVRAGATLDPQWYEGDPERERAAARMRGDPAMMAAMRGEIDTG